MQSKLTTVGQKQHVNGRGGNAQSSAGQQFDPWILWVTVRRCWGWAVPVGVVLTCVTAFVVVKTFVPRYRASHLLQANQDYVVFKGVMPVLEDISSTENALIMNPIVIDPVLNDPTLRRAPSLANPEAAEANLRRNLKVASGGTRSRLMVSYEDTDPAAAALVCNAVVESYLRQRDAIDSSRIANLERWLEPEIQTWKHEVEERQRSVQKLSEQTLGFAPGQPVATIENQSNLTLVANLRSQISDLTVQIAIIDANQAMNRDSMDNQSESSPNERVAMQPAVEPKTLSESEISQAVSQDPKVVESQALIARYKAIMTELELADMVRIRREYYLEIKSKHDQLASRLDALKRSARERAVTMLTTQAEAEYARLRSNAQSMLASRQQQDRELLASKLAVLQKQYDEELSQLEAFGGATAELQFAQEELAVATDVLTMLRERVAAIRTESRQDGAVRTVAKATPPKFPVEEIPVKKMALATSVVFCLPFLLGLLWEMRVQRVTDSSLVERSNTIAPIVGEIAKLPSGTRHGKGRRIFEESVDALRANLFLSDSTKSVRTFAVVSSMSGEGKSSVASQLALSIAKASGETVLLVDADLRYPDQHEIFGLDIGPGLSAVLSKQVTLEDAIDKSLGDLIHVLPAGRLDRSPHRLISQASMRDFVDEALGSYSFVVIDTAPVLAASESLAVASSVDSTLLCVMRDVSRMDSVTRSMRRLEAAGANIAGTVFSGVTASQYAYRYGNYHYAIAGDSQV